MRLRNWLLTGSSLTMLTLSPFAATAQDQELPQPCIDAGYTTLEECIAAQPAQGETPAEEAPAEETAPTAEEASAEETPEEEAPAEEPVPTEEAVPAEEPEEAAPEIVEEQVTPAPEEAQQAVPEVTQEQIAPETEVETEGQPDASQTEQGTSEDDAPETTQESEPVEETGAQDTIQEPVTETQVETEGQPDASQTEQGTFEEDAPATTQESEPVEETTSQDTIEQPVTEDQQAPAESGGILEPEQPQEAQQAPQADISAPLAAEVDAYNNALAEILSGGDADAAQAQIAQSRQNIAQLCAEAGVSDIDQCLANYGLSLPQVPNITDAPADQPATSADQPVADPSAPAASGAAAPVDPAAMPTEPVPEGVSGEAAPLTDSGKEEEEAFSDPAAAGQAAPTAAPVEAQVVTVESLPESDEAAQSEQIRSLAVEPAAAAEAEQGTAVAAEGNTTVTQVVTNNYINNITNITNNTTTTGDVTNNVTNNTQTNIGQQNNITVVEQDSIQSANTGDVFTQVILQVGTQLVVNSIGQDTDRFYNPNEDEIYYENLSNGRTRETITRPDGSQVITVRNRNGDVLRRSRIDPAGREYVLAYFDEQYSEDLIEWRDPAEDLPPLRINIPVQEYVLDASFADEEEVETFFRQPPVEQVARLYSIDEVKRSARVRDSVRKLEIGGLTFDTGAATISRDQVGALSNVAQGMLAMLEQNPTETFLIEGHTDAVGSDVSNLRLSDLRAATVARILTDFYDVPPENLATQGYGERYLKIRTEGDERENRRVTVRRITPLVTVAQQ